MTDITQGYHGAPTGLDARLAAIRDGFAAYRRTLGIHRQKRATYLRTLRELQDYRPHELVELRIDAADFESIARQQAGW